MEAELTRILSLRYDDGMKGTMVAVLTEADVQSELAALAYYAQFKLAAKGQGFRARVVVINNEMNTIIRTFMLPDDDTAFLYTN